MQKDADKSLKVLMVSTSYPENKEDWRGRFIANILQALAETGKTETALWAPPGDMPVEIKYRATEKEKKFLASLSRAGGIAKSLAHGNVTTLFNIVFLLKHLNSMYKRETHFDVMHVNWLQNILSLTGKNKTPLVISVLGKDFGLLRLPMLARLLRRIIKKRPCCITPNAEWMVPALKTYFGDIAEIRAVPFGVDPAWFKVVRSYTMSAKPRWLAISRVNKAKIGSLFDLGEPLFSGNKRELELFGPIQDDIAVPEWVGYHGATGPDNILTNLFPDACGLITLSRHDEGRPQVMLEAMAAGVPVIASDIPAHRDFISNGVTGFLVNNQEQLEKALIYLENTENNAKMGMAARIWVQDNIGTWADCAKRYIDIYRELLNDR